MAQPHSLRDLELFLFLSDLVAVCVCNLIICGDVLLNFGLYLDADAKRDEMVPCMSEVWWAAWWQPHLKCVDISPVCNSQVYVLLLCSLLLLSCHVSMHGKYSRISILLMRQEWTWIRHFPCRWQLVWILLLVLKLTFQEPVTELEPKTLHTLIMLESMMSPFCWFQKDQKNLKL
jgi:hypothetical protein